MIRESLVKRQPPPALPRKYRGREKCASSAQWSAAGVLARRGNGEQVHRLHREFFSSDFSRLTEALLQLEGKDRIACRASRFVSRRLRSLPPPHRGWLR